MAPCGWDPRRFCEGREGFGRARALAQRWPGAREASGRSMKGRSLVAVLALATASCRSSERTEPRPSPGGAVSRETGYSTGDSALDALQKEFLPILEANRREFTGQTGIVRGFGAGGIYPQVWPPHSATMIPATPHY